jgi:hypothetical protein
MSIFSRLFYLDEEQDALDFEFLKHKKDIMLFIAELTGVIEIGAKEGEANAAESLRDIYNTMENHPSSNLVVSLLNRQREINDKFGESDKMSLEDSLLKEMEIKSSNQVHGGIAKARKSRLTKEKSKKIKKVLEAIAKASFSEKAKKVPKIKKSIKKDVKKPFPKKAAKIKPKPKAKKTPIQKVIKEMKRGLKSIKKGAKK